MFSCVKIPSGFRTKKKTETKLWYGKWLKVRKAKCSPIFNGCLVSSSILKPTQSNAISNTSLSRASNFALQWILELLLISDISR